MVKLGGVVSTLTRGWLADVGPTQHRWLQCIFPVSWCFLRAGGDKGWSLWERGVECSRANRNVATRVALFPLTIYDLILFIVFVK